MSWWAVDVAAYALSRPRWLGERCDLDVDDVVGWVGRTRLSWVAGSANLAADVPWDELGHLRSPVELVERLLHTAAAEALTETMSGFALRSGAVGLAARRRLPLTTLNQFTGGVPTVFGDEGVGDLLVDGCADGHVHQGASLPLELMVHWVADSAASLGYRSEADQQAALTSIDEEELNPVPLLVLLHLIRAGDVPGTDIAALTTLGLAAARGDESSWYDLRRIPVPDCDETLLSIDALQARKRTWFGEAPERWLAIIQIESVIHACLTQRVAGLDVFAILFEQLATMRRARSTTDGKVEYFRRAIEQHATATPRLMGLELRLGDMALTGRRGDGMRRLRRDICDALLGYQAYLNEAEQPIRVTFPLGLIRTAPQPCGEWRFHAADLYRLVEDAMDLFDDEPELYRYVDGIDVCGREEDAPAWLFRPAFEHLAFWAAKNHRPMSFRCHAGEWFTHPVQGLRSIDDFLSMNVLPDRRIGHALALQSSAWDRAGDESLIDLFDDLVWAMATLHGRPRHGDLVRTLEERCRAVLPLVFPLFDSPLPDGDALAPLLWKAYQARSDPATLIRLGCLERVGDRLRFSGAPPSPGRETFERLACAALRVGHCSTTAVRSSGLDVPEVRNLLRDCYDALRDHVVARIKQINAVVEVCPTSNVLTGGVRGYAQHPLVLLADHGVRLTINSDDPSLFHSFLQDEIRHVLPLLNDAATGAVATGRELVGCRLPRPSLVPDLAAVVVRFCG